MNIHSLLSIFTEISPRLGKGMLKQEKRSRKVTMGANSPIPGRMLLFSSYKSKSPANFFDL
jgi:hypothetical protein